MKHVYSAALLALCVLVGCAGEPPASKTINVRAQLQENIKLALSNIAKEGESIRAIQNALKSALENIAKENGSVRDLEKAVKMQLSEMFPSGDTLNAIIQQILNSELARTIFAEQNIVASTDTEVTYRLSPPLCDKLDSVAPVNDSAGLVVMCKLFLSTNTIDLRVKVLTENSVELELWHGAIKDGASNPTFVISFLAAPNVLGTRFSLDGAKSLVDAVKAIFPDPELALPVGPINVEGFRTLSGELSLRLQFASQSGPSGCKNGERLCFVANVDRAIVIETESSEPFALSIGSSPALHPTATISAHSEGDFLGAFNFGAIEGSFKDSEDGHRLFVEAFSFNVAVRKANDSDATTVLIEKLKTGSRASFLESQKHKVTFELTNHSKEVETIKGVMARYPLAPELTVSPVSFVVTYADDSKPDCKTYERFNVKTDPNSLTQLVGGTNLEGYGYTGNCDRFESLAGYMFFSLVKVTSDPQVCTEHDHLQVKQGSLALQYTYRLNDSMEGTMSLDVARNQCLGV